MAVVELTDWDGLYCDKLLDEATSDGLCRYIESLRVGRGENVRFNVHPDRGPLPLGVHAHYKQAKKQIEELLLPGIKRKFAELYPRFDMDSVDWSPTVLLSGNTAAPHGAEPVRGWHLDRGDKLYAGMVYLDHTNDAADNPHLLASRNHDAETAIRIPHGRSNAIGWPNGMDTWHAVSDRPASNRNRAMLNFYCNSPIWVHTYEKIDGKDHTNPVSSKWT